MPYYMGLVKLTLFIVSSKHKIIYPSPIPSIIPIQPQSLDDATTPAKRLCDILESVLYQLLVLDLILNRVVCAEASILLAQKRQPFALELVVDVLGSLGVSHVHADTLPHPERRGCIEREAGRRRRHVRDVPPDVLELGARQSAEQRDVRVELVELGWEVLLAQSRHRAMVGLVREQGKHVALLLFAVRRARLVLVPSLVRIRRVSAIGGLMRRL